MNGAGGPYRQLWGQTLVRLLLTYLAPVVLLAVYFTWQFHELARQSRQRHLLSIAENQANTLDLFLRERLVNLTNLLDDPKLPPLPSHSVTRDSLARLGRDSDTFVDVGFFDETGTMVSYAGPLPELRGRNYRTEKWLTSLRTGPERFVITDLYLGFRQHPHFTIAVRRAEPGEPVAVRATLDPKRLGEYITSLKGAGEVRSVLVSSAGTYQTVDVPGPFSGVDGPLVPPHHPTLGINEIVTAAGSFDYAYCWLGMTDWALLVVRDEPGKGSPIASVDASLIAISAAAILAVFATILIRTTQVVRRQREQDEAKRELSGQLHHAARLASVGELAAGVAHEINNPLAVIAEEAGLLEDMFEPELGGALSPEEMRDHLGAIREAAFRARDITRKLLTFVRKADVRLDRHDVNTVLADAVGGLLEHAMAVSNIQVVRDFADGLPLVLADAGQLEQVIINLVTNAIDAMPEGGTLTLTTRKDATTVRVSVTDTGVGIASEHLERIFMPFHTTKEVGKGTGLGLSVSYGIIRSYGGDILVRSEPGAGSTFTIVIPQGPPDSEPPKEKPEPAT